MTSTAPQGRRQVLVGTFVHSKSRTELEYLHNSIVCVDDQGVIVSIESGYDDASAAVQETLEKLQWPETEVDVHTCKQGQFFFPGFIDTHVHASQYPNVGIFGKTTLLDWLEKYTFPLESSLKDLKKARRVYSACVRRTLSHGTTMAAYFATIDVAATNVLADLCLQFGQRALVGRVCMDSDALCPTYYRDESPEASVQLTRETIDHMSRIDPSGEMVAPIITPRFAPSCSGKAMSALAELRREHDLPVQTHISENRGEIALVKSLFPECGGGTGSYAGVYDDHGLLTPRTVLAHAVHLTDDEAALVASRGSSVSHCPCSNSSLTSGAARVRWLWNKGVEVGLGTDMSGGYSPSVLEAARQAALVSRHVAMEENNDDPEAAGSAKLTVEEVLYLATKGGALCLGVADRLGGFDVGKQWDAQLVGLREVGDDEDGNGNCVYEGEDDNVDVFGWEDWEERMAKWLYVGDDRNTKKVWVKGRLVHARRGA